MAILLILFLFIQSFCYGEARVSVPSPKIYSDVVVTTTNVTTSKFGTTLRIESLEVNGDLYIWDIYR